MIISLLLSAFPQTAAMAASVPTWADDPWFASTVEALLEAKRIPGAVVGVVDAEGQVTSGAFGWRDVDGELEMTTDTVFQLGSVTKSMTATVVARLAASGTLELDAPIGTYLGADVPESIAAITARELGTHTSGLPREPANRRNLPDSPSVMLPYSRAELLEGLANTTCGARGTWDYSNLGFLVLAYVAEAASGKSYRELLDELVLGPLAMNSSGVDPTPAHEQRMAVHYWPEDAEYVPRDRWRFGEVVSAHGVYSTVDDLGRFVAAQYRADSPLADSWDAMRVASEPIEAIGGRAMSFGWFVDRVPGMGELFAYCGEVDGHSACIIVSAEHRCGLIVLCNRGGDGARAVLEALMPGWIGRTLGAGAR